MKSTLIINDEEGQRSAELPKERIVLGASEQVSIPLRSRDSNLLPEHAVIIWNPAARDLDAQPRGRSRKPTLPSTSRPLATRGERRAQQPRRGRTAREPRSSSTANRKRRFFRDRPVVSKFSAGKCLPARARDAAKTTNLTARSGSNSTQKTPRFPKIHAVIEREGPNFFIVDKSRAGTELNGKFFSREMLVYGDRFRIGDYFFEFTGNTIIRVDQANLGRVAAHNLVVEVQKDGKPLRILQNINLEIQRGEFVGILGGSGQGKSTLLNALCGVNPASSGEVLISGIPLTSREQVNAAGVGFVPQDDIVHLELTVTEAITYSARLRLNLPPDADQLAGGPRHRAAVAQGASRQAHLAALGRPAQARERRHRTARQALGALSGRTVVRPRSRHGS